MNVNGVWHACFCKESAEVHIHRPQRPNGQTGMCEQNTKLLFTIKRLPYKHLTGTCIPNKASTDELLVYRKSRTSNSFSYFKFFWSVHSYDHFTGLASSLNKERNFRKCISYSLNSFWLPTPVMHSICAKQWLLFNQIMCITPNFSSCSSPASI